MKQVQFIVLFIFVFVLSGCNLIFGELSGIEISNELKRFIEENDRINFIHDQALEDVNEDTSYEYQDFFNFEHKDPRNVELEYTYFYNEFNNLSFIKNLIAGINDIPTNEYIEFEEFHISILLKIENGELYIDMYQHFDETDFIVREEYSLRLNAEHTTMVKISSIYDCLIDEIVTIKKATVIDEMYVESIEYFPIQNTFFYIYNSFEEQEYFKYTAHLDDQSQYIRQSFEYYIEEHQAFVSYDFKDGFPEDYRVKLFNQGHRIVKVDVNIKPTKDTETMLEWNLLTVSGWDSVDVGDTRNYVIKDGLPTMIDYAISIQLKGYGKIIAEKTIIGDVLSEDISLSGYGLVSPVSLEQVNLAHDYFLDNYESELLLHGFIIHDLDNLNIILNKFTAFNNRGIMDPFIQEWDIE